MTRPRRRAVLVTGLAVWTVAGAVLASETPAPDDGLRALASAGTSADHQLVQRLLAETGAERALSSPSWGEYLAVVARAIDERIDALFSGLGLGQARWPWVMAWVLLGLVAASLAVILARWLAGLWARRRSGRADADAVALVEAGSGPVSAHSREAWRAEIEARLDLHQIDAALEAVWWWFACSLTERAIDPAWTSRELLEAAQRRELGPQAAALDRMIYGPTRPGPHEVRHFVHRLEAAPP